MGAVKVTPMLPYNFGPLPPHTPPGCNYVGNILVSFFLNKLHINVPQIDHEITA